jgi:hypothetical protein
VSELVGYKLIATDGSTVTSWGGVWGQCPGVPEAIVLPNGDQVHGAAPGDTLGGGRYTLTPWMMDAPVPSTNPADYTLSRRQIFRGLIVAGVTTDPDTFMRTILGAIADPTVRALALADWINEPAAGYHRTDPLFNEADLLAAAHMTAAQVDQLWLLSAQQGA